MIDVLLVDDERRLVNAYKIKLSEEKMTVQVAYTGREALAKANKSSFDICVLDIRLPDIEGTDLLKKLKEIQPMMEVVMLTGYASLDTAINSMKSGAYDYLTKPCQFSQLEKVITKAYEKKSLKEKNLILEEQLTRFATKDKFIGESPSVKYIMKQVSLLANSNVPVLILGETGTGKELIARGVHELSTRSRNPFVAVNSSALQENILESEIFGYKKGAFTGADTDKIGLLEIANKGTFFFDEIGDMSPGIQAKILRVLETGVFRRLGDTREIKIDTRYICATNKNLEKEVVEKAFRKDLFYRLNTFVLNLPPLRERKEDIAMLCEHFIHKFTKGNMNKHISKEAMNKLKQYEWPGNVRELANVLERALLTSENREEITLEDLPQKMVCEQKVVSTSNLTFELTGEVVNLDELQTKYIRHVTELMGNNKSKVARLLGISRCKLYHRLNKGR
jgi:two-component system response regulator AtoC